MGMMPNKQTETTKVTLSLSLLRLKEEAKQQNKKQTRRRSLVMDDAKQTDRDYIQHISYLSLYLSFLKVELVSD